MTLVAYPITTLARAQQYLGLDPSDSRFHTPALEVYYDSGSSATSATVAVDQEGQTVDLVTSDASGDASIDLTSVTTIGAVATAIDATSGWECNLLTHTDEPSASLLTLEAVSAYGIDNKQILKAWASAELDRIINGTTAEIETYLGRKILSRTYVEMYQFTRDTCQFVLRQPDVTLVSRVAVDTARLFGITNTGTADTRVTVTPGRVLKLLRRAAGSGDTEDGSYDLTGAANDTVAELTALIDAVGSSWATTTYTSNTGDITAFAVPFPPKTAKSVYVDIYGTLATDMDYYLDDEAGVVYLGASYWPFSLRSPSPIRQVWIEYTAGFATVPDDIDRIALEMIGYEWKKHEAGGSETQSFSLGPYSETVATTALQSDQGGSWMDRLQKYRRRTL